MAENFNKNMANQFMAIIKDAGFEDRLVNDDSETSTKALEEVMSVLMAVSARIGAAYLMNNMRTAETPEEALGMAGELVAATGANYEVFLGIELESHLNRLQAMEEKEELSKSGKPTTH